jgi:hypothetical protein
MGHREGSRADPSLPFPVKEFAMDSLALLCNLYGDGPSTLRRLRDLGCRSAFDVVERPVEDLAAMLRSSVDVARRLQRQARELAQRAPDEHDAAAEVLLPGTASEIVLRPELLDGLDLAQCVALRGQGIESVEDLTRAAPLEVSRALECGVTRVMRLQFLARRLLGARSPVGQREPELAPLPRRTLPPGDATRFSPAERPREALPAPLADELERWSRAPRAEPVAESAGPFA